MTDAPLLAVDDVTVRFGANQALTAVDLTVPAGEVVGLIGPNGAGKTTLFNVVTGLQRPTRGRILFEGRDISRLDTHHRARLDLVRRLDILRTPTVLVLDATGRVIRRASGQPRRADVIAALGEAV